MGASYNLVIIAGSSKWSDEPFGDDYLKKPADWGSNPYVPIYFFNPCIPIPQRTYQGIVP